MQTVQCENHFCSPKINLLIAQALTDILIIVLIIIEVLFLNTEQIKRNSTKFESHSVVFFLINQEKRKKLEIVIYSKKINIFFAVDLNEVANYEIIVSY